MEEAERTRPTHPGLLLAATLRQLGCAKADVARHLRISRQSLYDLLAGRQSLTPTMALRIAKLTGTTPKRWLDIQQAYDLAAARRRDGALIDAVPALEQAW